MMYQIPNILTAKIHNDFTCHLHIMLISVKRQDNRRQTDKHQVPLSVTKWTVNKQLALNVNRWACGMYWEAGQVAFSGTLTVSHLALLTTYCWFYWNVGSLSPGTADHPLLNFIGSLTVSHLALLITHC